jgi:hypothetical protein
LPQFIAFAVSVLMAFSIANGASIYGTFHHVRMLMPPVTDNDPDGVSGGGPVGSVPQPVPTPPPGKSSS